MITTRPARQSDIADLHPEMAGVSYRAWAVDMDGEPAGVVGLAMTRPRACLFCSFREELRPFLPGVAIMRLVKRTERLIRERGRPVLAIRDPNEPKAESILTRLGFRYLDDVDGDAVYLWSPA